MTDVPAQMLLPGFADILTEGTTVRLTTTETVVLAVQPFASVTVTVYVPKAAVVTLEIVGFCTADVNPLGPDHE